jgi:hypothetical protein
MNPETLLTRYEATKKQLREAQRDLTRAEGTHLKVKRVVEKLITDEAGGDKGLGSNEAERKRNLEYQLIMHSRYQDSLMQLEEAQFHVQEAEDDVDVIKFEMRLYEASLKEQEILYVKGS